MSTFIFKCVGCREDFSSRDRAVYCDVCKAEASKRRQDKKNAIEESTSKELQDQYGIIGQKKMLKRIKTTLSGCDEKIRLCDVITLINAIKPDD